MAVINEERVEKTFTNTNELVYNKNKDATLLEEQLKSERYLPTNDVAFKKMLASNENIHISEGFLKDLALNDPLEALQIDTLVIETPYNFKDKNQLDIRIDEYNKGILYTEVDYACVDPNGARFVIEMQMRGEAHLEKRIAYNIAGKYTAMYAGVDKGMIKYDSLRPVISIVILKESYFKNDPHPVRYLRPYDTSIGVHKKDLLMGLEIYLELDKDPSRLPKSLQDIFQFFKTGEVPADAAKYLKEATNQMKKANFTPEERKLADFHVRAQLKRISEDEYVREEGREQGRQQGREEGLEEGFEQGRQQEKIANAQKMIEENLPVEMIERYTGLSVEKIKQLLLQQ